MTDIKSSHSRNITLTAHYSDRLGMFVWDKMHGPEIMPVDHTPWTKPISATVETVRMIEEIKAAKKGEVQG